MIKTKQKFMELSQAGRLGNYLRSWDTLRAMEESGYEGFLTIRNRVSASPHFLAVTHSDYAEIDWQAMVHRGARVADLYFQQVPTPDA